LNIDTVVYFQVTVPQAGRLREHHYIVGGEQLTHHHHPAQRGSAA